MSDKKHTTGIPFEMGLLVFLIVCIVAAATQVVFLAVVINHGATIAMKLRGPVWEGKN